MRVRPLFYLDLKVIYSDFIFWHSCDLFLLIAHSVTTFVIVFPPYDKVTVESCLLKYESAVTHYSHLLLVLVLLF